MQEDRNVSGRRFTIVVEFEGTTSVSQLPANDPTEAVRRWFERLGNGDPYGLSADQARRLKAEFLGCEHRRPVPLSGLFNAWCTSVFGGDTSALFNIILTEGEGDDR